MTLQFLIDKNVITEYNAELLDDAIYFETPIIVAGKPAVGKTTFIKNLLREFDDRRIYILSNPKDYAKGLESQAHNIHLVDTFHTGLTLSYVLEDNDNLNDAEVIVIDDDTLHDHRNAAGLRSILERSETIQLIISDYDHSHLASKTLPENIDELFIVQLERSDTGLNHVSRVLNFDF